MATIKSYTNIEQSKKLAEILPIESADLHYCLENRDVATGYEIGIVPFIQAREFKDKCNIIDIQPAYSLAALLNIIPKEIFNGEYIINITESISNKWIITYDSCEDGQSFHGAIGTDDNLVDACYEIIVKLHELKML